MLEVMPDIRFGMSENGLTTFHGPYAKPTFSATYGSLILDRPIKEEMFVRDDDLGFFGIRVVKNYDKGGKLKKSSSETGMSIMLDGPQLLELLMVDDMLAWDKGYKIFAKSAGLKSDGPDYDHSKAVTEFTKKFEKYMVVSRLAERPEVRFFPVKDDSMMPSYDKNREMYRKYFQKMRERAGSLAELYKGRKV